MIVPARLTTAATSESAAVAISIVTINIAVSSSAPHEFLKAGYFQPQLNLGGWKEPPNGYATKIARIPHGSTQRSHVRAAEDHSRIAEKMNPEHTTYTHNLHSKP